MSDSDEIAEDPEIVLWWVEESARADEWFEAFKHGIDDDLVDAIPEEHRAASASPWIRDRFPSGWAMIGELRNFINRRGLEAAVDEDERRFWLEEPLRPTIDDEGDDDTAR